MEQEKKLLFKIRILISTFVIFLVLSGITAFPIETQLAFAVENMSFLPIAIQDWFAKVYNAVAITNSTFPFLSYGTDWLAFAHLVIAVAFVGPLKYPVKNIWIIQFGMIACLMVFPLALIAGPIREIPLFWILFDCSFGVVGFFPLWFCYKKIKKLEMLSQSDLSG